MTTFCRMANDRPAKGRRSRRADAGRFMMGTVSLWGVGLLLLSCFNAGLVGFTVAMRQSGLALKRPQSRCFSRRGWTTALSTAAGTNAAESRGCSLADLPQELTSPAESTIFGSRPHDFTKLRRMLRVGVSVFPGIALVVRLLPPVAAVALLPVAAALIVESVARGRSYSTNGYVRIVLPMYYSSLFLWPLLPLSSWTLKLAVFASACALGAARMALMTVVFHRYAAHAAFRCNFLTNLVLGTVGCLANQGGPLWWASKHRCHHRFADGPRDPHSPHDSSPEKAFTFFSQPQHEPIDEEFVPSHCDSRGMRIIDAFSSLPLVVETCLAYYTFGLPGLWISYTSAWMSQAATLWFNVIAHASPSSEDGKSRASNYFGWDVPSPIFWPLQLLVVGIFPFIGEKAHRHHHDNPGLARRPGLDLPYFFLVWPLEKLGLAHTFRVSVKSSPIAVGS